MSNWLNRVGALWGARSTASNASRPVPPSPARVAIGLVHTDAEPSAPPVAAEAPVMDLQVPFFDWLTGVGPALETALHDSERRLLTQIDAVLASDASRNALLPRAPAVIPQLINSLRDEGQSTDALAQRVARDPHLVAEVIRMANGAGARGADPVTDLAAAIGRLGLEGLRRAIARVVLKPMFDGHVDSLSARSAARLWQHSEAQAAACQQLAVARGLAPFEGYLTGLMHNIGWSAALRVIDRADGGTPKVFSRAFIQKFEPRRERLFALLVIPWQLTESLSALGTEMLAPSGLAAARSPLAQALRAADAQAIRELVPIQAPAPEPEEDTDATVEISVLTN